MDYEKLAASFGGAPAQPSLDDLASKFGGAAVKEEPAGLDELAKQFGGTLQQKPAPTESGGFWGTAGTTLEQTVKSFLPGAKQYFNVGDQKAAAEEQLKYREESNNAYKQTEFSEIGDAFKSGDVSGAVGKLIDKTKEVAGGSLGAMAPAIAAGQAGTMIGGPLAGTIAFGITGFATYVADYIGRQKEEQQKQGRIGEDIDRLPLTAAAAGSALLDVVGGKIFKPVGALMGIEGRAAADKVAMEIVEAATKPGAYKRAVAKGIAEGVAFEVPQEVTQQVLERWQAGLPLNPFEDPEAAREYGEAAGGALLIGGPMGGGSHVMQPRAARQSPEGEALLKKATEGSVYEALSQETEAAPYDPESRLAELERKGFGTKAKEVIGPDGKKMTIPGEQGEFFTRAEKDEYDALKEGRHGLAESINATARTRNELAGQPGAITATRGAGEPDTGRVVPPRQPVSEAPEGEISEPGALAPSQVDKWAARAEGALGTAAVSP